MIAVHAPGAHSHPLNWLILSLLIVVGIAARHLMILFDRRQPASPAWLFAGAPLAAALAVLGVLSISPDPANDVLPSEGRVPFSVVRGIVDLRCVSCHSRSPTDKAFLTAPNGLSFGTAEEIAVRAAMIKSSTVVTRTMPPRNTTRMTDEERVLISRWVDQGAHIAASQ